MARLARRHDSGAGRGQGMSGNLGAMMAGGNPAQGRRAHDYYATPPEATRALLAAEGEHLRAHIGDCRPAIWEPACGDGAICRVLEAEGWGPVVASDLIDRGHGEGGIDFLASTKLRAPAIITNPPFRLAEAFVRHALLTLRCGWLALLLKATWWHAAERAALWRECPPAAIHPLTWRLDFTGGGSPAMECAWMVWDSAIWHGGCLYRPLSRPGDSAMLPGLLP